MENNKLKIGIIGLGTVGCGVVKVLEKFNDIEIVLASVKNLNKKRDVELDCLTTDSMQIATNPDIDVVVEVAGGCGILDVLLTAIKNKKHIVTANKELLARHGAQLFDLARENGVVILYEAAVAGGIPLILPIKTSLAANEFKSVAGILNGTTNYILTKMEEDNLSYEDCLAKAQALGYAETDPTGDVEGYDAMYKIAILANIVFGKRIDVNKIYREGITNITAQDIKIADELGYKIKLIAQAKKNENGIDVRVHPMLVSKANPISDIKNATNAVMLNGFPVDKVMFVGPGAGQFPTASSVVGDILSLKAEFDKGSNILPMTVCHHSEYANQTDVNETKNCYYLSIVAQNVKGVIGLIGCACAEYNVNISCVLQKGDNGDGSATIIVITEECLEKDMNLMIQKLQNDNNIKIANKIRVL
ncbi:MAG: homoserine dehydrogenase [Cyanobacteria bacterium SIG27]|nr:homoserine dehydrogenase [Cyanobacteria bacterium SIG27]MBQ9149935.1 homoserine dehydrogenase [bacterium]